MAAPIVLGLEIGAAGCGIIAVAGKCIGRRVATKALKHDKIRVLADSKMNTIASYVSKALDDGEITDQEFQMIKGEVEKYYILKNEIRRSCRSDSVVSSSEKKRLIKLGRDEARRSFMKKILGEAEPILPKARGPRFGYSTALRSMPPFVGVAGWQHFCGSSSRPAPPPHWIAIPAQ